MPLTLGDLSTLFGGELHLAKGTPLQPVGDLLTDSREVKPGDLFIALKGEKMDGHLFVDSAIQAGATTVVVNRDFPLDGANAIVVDNTTEALKAACKQRLADLGCLVVGITGSAGKTTCKEMCALALGDGTAKTPGNLNTWTGIPRAVLQLEPPVRYFIAEMAMSAPGEIADLCTFVPPTGGILLNVGMAHIGLLGSIEAIADAKAELLRALPIDGFAILNADDEMVRRVSGRSTAPVIWYGYADEADVRIAGVESRGLQGSSFILDCKGTTVKVQLSLPGTHVITDAAAVMALAQQLGVDLTAAAERLSSFRPMKHRGEVVQGVNGVTIYDDSYNSSPASLRYALEVLHSAGSARKLAVVGDMLELGEAAEGAHQEAGRLVARSADAVIAVGEYAPMVAEAAIKEGMSRETVWTAANAEAAIPLVLPWCQSDVAMLVKGSRAVGLDKLIEAISEKQDG